MYIYAHIRVCVYTHIHVHTHKNSHTHIQIKQKKLWHLNAYFYIFSYLWLVTQFLLSIGSNVIKKVHTYIHDRTYELRHTHTNAHVSKDVLTCICTRTRNHIRKFALVQTKTLICNNRLEYVQTRTKIISTKEVDMPDYTR